MFVHQPAIQLAYQQGSPICPTAYTHCYAWGWQLEICMQFGNYASQNFKIGAAAAAILHIQQNLHTSRKVELLMIRNSPPHHQQLVHEVCSITYVPAHLMKHTTC